MDAVTIYRKWMPTVNEWQRRDGYWALNTTGGDPVAVISGPVEVVVEGGIEWGLLDDRHYALRDVLAFARAGKHGLAIAEDRGGDVRVPVNTGEAPEDGGLRDEAWAAESGRICGAMPADL